MSRPSPTAQMGLAAMLPLAAVLAAAFFIPWVECAEVQGGVQQSRGHASAWDMTRGKLRIPVDVVPGAERPSLESWQKRYNDATPARPWFALSLVIPVAALGLALAVLLGKLRAGATARVLAILALGGAFLAVTAQQVDYTPARVANKKPQIAEDLEQVDKRVAAGEKWIEESVEAKRQAIEQELAQASEAPATETTPPGEADDDIATAEPATPAITEEEVRKERERLRAEVDERAKLLRERLMAAAAMERKRLRGIPELLAKTTVTAPRRVLWIVAGGYGLLFVCGMFATHTGRGEPRYEADANLSDIRPGRDDAQSDEAGETGEPGAQAEEPAGDEEPDDESR